MTGNKPEFKAVANVGERFWREVGAAWNKETGNISVSLNLAPISKEGKMNFLLVPNGSKELKTDQE